ncbi:MAG: PKD domain-containing protein [Deltaproteobacteria bacterium]|nr:PKD domain-containing protein [Deltaproteobacteria bacterium]
MPIVLFAGCESEGGAPPAPELFADPEVCDVPCELVLDSGLEPSEGRLLTFSWDLGDGPVPGDARLLHMFEEAGSYTVSVTASDGQSSTTDTTTVLVEEQPKASGVVDESGGTVSQGACTVTVPEDVAPEALALEVTELPSMQLAAERSIGTGEFTALGSAYDVDMPLKPSTAVAISVKDAGAEGVNPSELAWLVRMIAHPVPPANRPDVVYSPAPLADYVLVPVTKVDEDGTAHGEIYDRKRFQLVRLNEPLIAESVALEAATAQKAATPLAPIIIFKWNPSRITITDYKNAIVEGLNESRKALVDKGQFRGPEGAVIVYVGKLKNPDWDAFVPFFDRHTIHMRHTLESTDIVKKVVAHEFFHLIQNHYTNQLSTRVYHQKDGWFAEGTATWAMDEVFDDIRDSYHATPWARFTIPLLKEAETTAALHAYRNVAFWKWAETNNPTIIRRTLEAHYASTHSTLAGARNPVENGAIVDYLLAYWGLGVELDFLDFTYKARYLKDFDTGETRDGEIWSQGSKQLGRPKEIQFTNGANVSKVAGDAPNNTVTVKFELKPHLTAEVIQIKSVDLEGTLHVRFLAPSAPLDAKLLVVDKASYDKIEADTVRDTSSTSRDLTAKLSPDEHAYIFVVDPRWNYTTSTAPIEGELEVWVEDPCGSIGGNVIDVTTESELQSALMSASPGSTVRLAAGTYSPPIIDWPTPEFGPFGGNVLVQDLTLMGAGEGQTTIVMTGDPYAGLGLKTYGNATLRNLTIDAGDSEPAIDCLDAKHVTLCNVTLLASSTTDFGIIWGPWSGGSTSLSLYDSTLAHPDREQFGIGIFLQSCYETPAIVSAELSLTSVSGWGQGVLYSSGEGQCGSVSVSADCDGFSNNDYNVVEETCSGGVCTTNEQCP